MKDMLFDTLSVLSQAMRDPLIVFCFILLVVVLGSLIHWVYDEYHYRKAQK